MDTLYIPNTQYKVERGNGKIIITDNDTNKIYKTLLDRFPSDDAQTVFQLLRKMPELAKKSSIGNELQKVASLLSSYNSEISDQIIDIGRRNSVIG